MVVNKNIFFMLCQLSRFILIQMIEYFYEFSLMFP